MIAKPIISARDAAGKIKEGDSLMVGGFLGCGSPHSIIQALRDIGTKNLTLICNDTAVHDLKTGKVTELAPSLKDGIFGLDSSDQNMIQFEINDMAGNTGTSSSYIIQIDTLAPDSWNAISPSTWYTSSQSPTVTISVLDSGSGLDTTSAYYR